MADYITHDGIRVGWSLESTARAMGPTISAEELVRRARKRCKQHRNRLAGVCQECVLTEIEQAIADKHPELDRGDMFELVLECLTGEDEPASPRSTRMAVEDEIEFDPFA